MADDRTTLSAGDAVVIAAYFTALAGVAVWAWCKQRQGEAAGEGGESYFLGGRQAGAFAVGAALFCSNIGAEHMIGMAGAGAKEGFAAGFFEWGAMPILLALGWYFLPLYLQLRIYTMPSFLGERYGPRARALYGVISIVLYVLTKISGGLYACSVLFEVLFGTNIYVSSVILIAGTATYTVFGGMLAVIYTEMLQAVFLVAGGLMLMVYAMNEVGGWSSLRTDIERADPSVGWYSLWRPASDDVYPWTGFVFGYPIQSVWYWCCDQVIVQRGLAAESAEKAKIGSAMCALLKVLPPFLFVMSGMASRVLYPDEVEGDNDRAYPILIARVLPSGTRGVIAAAMLSALMSSLAAVFNSCSAIATMDFYTPLRPNSTPETLVRVGRVGTVVTAVVGCLWVPVIPVFTDSLWDYLQAMSAYFSPPVLVPFVVGIWWDGATEDGAVSCMAVGFVLALVRVGLTVPSDETQEGYPQPLRWYATFPFLNLAPVLFAVCTAVLVAVSKRKGAAGPPARRIAADDDGGGTEMSLPGTRSEPRSEELGNLIPNTNVRKVRWWCVEVLLPAAVLGAFGALCVIFR
eukprot:TRINITY_DN1063_c2_g1_i1.p1 TRINITY_DN1063_c2_g1~~TRINITY_DN1063_c2_g1_i1.p1  ORF type:complete len:600 (+),score=121.89 TRINITY_DN1063_c2_g1_i1:76-1800(+)